MRSLLFSSSPRLYATLVSKNWHKSTTHQWQRATRLYKRRTPYACSFAESQLRHHAALDTRCATLCATHSCGDEHQHFLRHPELHERRGWKSHLWTEQCQDTPLRLAVTA